MLECARQAKKRLLLTATPIVNSYADLAALINIMYGENLVGKPGEIVNKTAKIMIDDTVATRDKIKQLLKDHIDYFTNIDSSKYPLTRQHYVEVVMEPEDREKYKKYIHSEQEDMEYIFKEPSRFYNAHRRLVNKISDEYFSSKINAMIDKIKNSKTLVYTNWLSFGVDPIERALKQHDVKYGIFTGNLKKQRREQMVKDYNENKINVLVVTSAGSEGLDLKETKNVIVLDPPWHPAGLNQIIGRAVRYESHKNLPKHERIVNIYKMIMVVEPGISWQEDVQSGDALLYQIIERKSQLTRDIHNLFENIDKNSGRKYQYDGNKYIIFGRMSCPYCVKTKNMLDGKGIRYEFNDMEEMPEHRITYEHMLSKSISNMSEEQQNKLGIENGSYPYVPVVFKNDQFIGGYSELEKDINN